MRVEAAVTEDLDVVAGMWVALAEEQRQYDSYLLAEENREAIGMVLAHHAVDDGLLVARDDDTPIGFVSFEVRKGGFRRSVVRGVVQNLYVVPERRDEGVGTALLDAAEENLIDDGVDVISIESMASNERARRLYRRRGFTPHRIEYGRRVESDTHTSEDE